MDLHAVVTKTKKGEEELLTRAHGLDRNLRYVLILVDGTSSVQQLVEGKGAAMSDVQGSLQRLCDEGYIAIGGVVGADEGCDVPGDRNIATIKAALIATANEVLGADAPKIVAKLEAAPDSREGLQEAVNSCKKMVKLLIDEKKAEVLMARCSGVLQGL